MKIRWRTTISAFLVASSLACMGVFAAEQNARRTETISVVYDNIQVYMDGKLVDLKDANGNKVEPFIYNGTTYLPVRAISQAMGKDVSWDGVEKVAYLGSKPGDVENWLNVCGPYQYKHGKEYLLKDNQYFTMSGKKYTNGFVLDAQYFSGKIAEAMFNLNGEYKSLTFTVGHIDGTELYNAQFDVYIDGIIAYTTTLKYDDVAKKITIPLDGALQMKFVLTHPAYSSSTYGFSEGVFEKLQ